MIYFIRHAESLANRADAEFKKKFGVELFKETEEYITYKFSKNQLDPEITENGMNQCKNAQQKMKDIEIDAVIVSPLQRTLKTCSLIFDNHKSNPPVFVEPYFRTILEATNDLSNQIERNMELHPRYDFSSIKDKEAWYVQTMYEKDRKMILKELQGTSGEERKEKALDLTLPIMKENWFARRANREKEDEIQERLLPSLAVQLKILEGYLSKYKNIAVVSHGECIKRYAGYKIANCQIYPYFKEKLSSLKVKDYQE